MLRPFAKPPRTKTSKRIAKPASLTPRSLPLGPSPSIRSWRPGWKRVQAGPTRKDMSATTLVHPTLTQLSSLLEIRQLRWPVETLQLRRLLRLLLQAVDFSRRHWPWRRDRLRSMVFRRVVLPPPPPEPQNEQREHQKSDADRDSGYCPSAEARCAGGAGALAGIGKAGCLWSW